MCLEGCFNFVYSILIFVERFCLQVSKLILLQVLLLLLVLVLVPLLLKILIVRSLPCASYLINELVSSVDKSVHS